MWDESEARGDSASTDWQSILPQFFRSKQKNQENKARDCVRSHTMLRMWVEIEVHNKREDSVNFKSMLQVLDHDPDTRIQQEVNISTTSPEVF